MEKKKILIAHRYYRRKHFTFPPVGSFHTNKHCFMLGMPYNLEEEGDN